MDLAQSVQEFFSAARALETSPTDRALRQDMLDHAGRLTHQVRHSHDTLDRVRTEAAHHAQNLVGSINDELQALAKADKALLADPQNPDLRDARDARVDLLADMIGIRPIHTPDGSLHLVTASGAALVETGRAHPISLTPGPPMHVRTHQGDGLEAVGGELGGTLRAHDEVLAEAVDKLDAFATAFGSAFNAIHQGAAGQDGVDRARPFRA